MSNRNNCQFCQFCRFCRFCRFCHYFIELVVVEAWQKDRYGICEAIWALKKSVWRRENAWREWERADRVLVQFSVNRIKWMSDLMLMFVELQSFDLVLDKFVSKPAFEVVELDRVASVKVRIFLISQLLAIISYQLSQDDRRYKSVIAKKSLVRFVVVL